MTSREIVHCNFCKTRMERTEKDPGIWYCKNTGCKAFGFHYDSSGKRVYGGVDNCRETCCRNCCYKPCRYPCDVEGECINPFQNPCDEFKQKE